MKRFSVSIVLLLAGVFAVAGCKKKSGGDEGNPYEGTTLYIYSNESGNYDIYALRVGDDVPQKVIGTAADEKHPFVLGDKIYFSANDDGDYDIYVANLDGSGRSKVADYPNDEVQPAVSPNGRYLAFTWGTAGGWRVVLYDLQSGDTVKTFGNSGKTNESPHFVGNDTLLMTLQDYGSAYSQDPWMYVISADTLTNPRNTSSTQEAHWRVKSGKVVFARMGLYGENPRITVADFPSFGNERDIYSSGISPINPVWSPDGTHVAVSHAGTCLIVLVEVSSGEVVDTLYYRPGKECSAFSWK